MYITPQLRVIDYLGLLALFPEFIYLMFITLLLPPDLVIAIVEAEPPKPKAAKKRKQGKLDAAGNKPEVSVYAKAYNKVKAQFVRIRYTHILQCHFCHV